jgi:branched-chain amino acid transport system permease protein
LCLSISPATTPSSSFPSYCSHWYWLALWRLIHSPLGRIFSAIKQNETRAAFVGYNVWLYKWLAFTLSTAVAGLAGALFAMAQQSAYPNVMSLHNSGFVVMMVLIGGGLVSFWGPVIGATFFILARDLLGAYTETWLLWYGLVFMAMVLFKPEGIAGAWQAWKARPRRPVALPSPQPHPQEVHYEALRGQRPVQTVRRPGGAARHHAQFQGR